MIDSLYFVSDPWEKALELICIKDMGEIVEIQVQAVCNHGSLDDLVSRWKGRIESSAGLVTSWDVLHGEGVVSIIGKTGSAIIRIFIDDSGDSIVENFELVSQRGLIIWNNTVHPISLIYEGTHASVILSDIGPAALQKECRI